MATSTMKIAQKLGLMDRTALEDQAELVGVDPAGKNDDQLTEAIFQKLTGATATPVTATRRPINFRGWIAGDNLSILLNVVSIGVAFWPGMNPTTAYWLFLIATGWDTVEEVKETWPAWMGFHDKPRVLTLRTVSLVLNVVVVIGLLAPTLLGWTPNLIALAFVRALDLIFEVVIKRMTRKSSQS